MKSARLNLFHLNYGLVIAIVLIQSTLLIPAAVAQTGANTDFLSTLTSSEREWLKNNSSVRYTGIPDWEPLGTFSASGRYTGLAADYLDVITEITGLEFDITPVYDRVRALQLAVDGKVDVISGDSSDIILNKTFTPIESSVSSSIAIVTKDINSPVKDLTGFNHRRVGIVTNYGYAQTLFKEYPDVIFEEVDNTRDGLNKVSSGELGAFVTPRTFSRSILALNGYQDLIFAGETDISLTATLFVSNEAPELFSIISKARSFADPTLLREIVSRWLSIPVALSNDSSSIELTTSERAYLESISPITFTGDPDWLPYEAFDEDGQYIGQVADHLKIIQRMLGVEFEFIPTKTWTESVELAKSGEVDILSETSSSFLSEQLLFTKNYSKTPVVFVMRNTEDYVDSFEQIRDQRIGLVKDYGITSAVVTTYPNQKFYFFDSIQDALVGVSTRKIDAVFTNSPQALYNIKVLGLQNVRLVGKSDFDLSLAFAVQPDKPELVAILNRALDAIINSKEQQAIYDKWNAVEYSEKINYRLIYQILAAVLFILAFGSLWLYKLKKEINRRKRIAKKLLIAEQDAKMANKAKSNFLAVISHELRTPLNGIMGMLELLEKSKLTSEQMTMAHLARTSSENLLSILNDVLDFSKIEANKMDLIIEPANINEMIEACVNTLAQNAYDKGLFLEMFVSPELNRQFQIDAARISQIVNNFLNNAIKFTSKGGVSVYAKLLSNDDGTNQLSISIKDTGIGISEDNQAKLFQDFVQVGVESQRQFSGSGLGLSICKRLSELMGGSIELESNMNFGTKINYSQAVEYSHTDVSKKEKWCGFRFSILSNDRLVCDILEQHLTYSGGSVHVPSIISEKTAMLKAMIDKLDVDIIFIDKALLLSLVREEKLGNATSYIKQLIPHTKVIQLVNEDNLSANSFMPNNALLNTNPLQPSFLELLVDISLDIVDDTDVLPSANNAQSPKKSIKLLVAEDHPTNRSLITRQLDHLGYQYEVVEDGYQAMSTWKNGNFDGVLTDCHMPNTDGYALSRYIREHSKVDIPIIAMTANALSGEKEKCIQNGMNDLLVKPIQIADLDKCLSHWIASNATSRGDDVEKTDNKAMLDRDKLRELSEIFLGDDNVAPMLESYWRATDNDLAEINEGLKSDNKAIIKNVAHKMLGAASIVKADQVVSSLKIIENGADDLDFNTLAGLISDLEDNIAAFKSSLSELGKY